MDINIRTQANSENTFLAESFIFCHAELIEASVSDEIDPSFLRMTKVKKDWSK